MAKYLINLKEKKGKFCLKLLASDYEHVMLGEKGSRVNRMILFIVGVLGALRGLVCDRTDALARIE